MPASVKPLTPAPQMAMRGVAGALANERVVRSVVARRLMLFTVLARFLGFVVFQGFEYVVYARFRLLTWLLHPRFAVSKIGCSELIAPLKVA